jgi:hypothetical protein
VLSCAVIRGTGIKTNMDSIQEIFLRAKHWQIFFLLLGTYALSVLATTRLSPKLKPGIAHNPTGLILLIAVGIAPYVLSICGWLWAAGMLFNANLSSDLQLRTGFFRFATIYAVFGLSLGLPVTWASNQVQRQWLELPQLFGVICIVYILKFTAKTFVTLNRGRRSAPWSYFRYMVQFLAAPLFVWQIQPQLNRLYAKSQRKS